MELSAAHGRSSGTEAECDRACGGREGTDRHLRGFGIAIVGDVGERGDRLTFQVKL